MSTTGLGYISTNTFNQKTDPIVLPMDESVCGMIFDYSNFDSPFDGFSDTKQCFENEQVQLINNLEEAENVGIWDNNFMKGLPYYHIKAFYDYIGKDTPLYICFTKDSKRWSAIENMQITANGKIFNIGIWTSKKLWNNSLDFTNLCSNIEAAAELLDGKIGSSTNSYCPVSILLCPNTTFDNNDVTLSKVPNGTTFNFPKLSVCLAQNNTAEVLNMQRNLPNKAPVGCLGVLMGCVCLAYAEENIGYVAKFNLNKDDAFNNAGIYFGDTPISIDNFNQYSSSLIAKGYIIPIKYNGKEAEVFFSGAPTFSHGDYYSLANNRVMHKARRAIQSALISYINGNYLVTTDTGNLTAASQAILTDAIIKYLDAYMLNGDGQRQITGRRVSFLSRGGVLQNDEVSMQTLIQPISSNSVINERDDFQV